MPLRFDQNQAARCLREQRSAARQTGVQRKEVQSPGHGLRFRSAEVLRQSDSSRSDGLDSHVVGDRRGPHSGGIQAEIRSSCSSRTPQPSVRRAVHSRVTQTPASDPEGRRVRR